MLDGRFREYDYALDVSAYHDADHRWLAELDGLAVHTGAPHQRMGTRGIDEDAWFVFDSHSDRELALRRRLLDEQRDLVFACRPEADAAGAEAFDLIGRWLGAHGHAVPDRGDDPSPLAAAGLKVADDLVLMCRDDGGWRLSAAMLCFPSYWQLGDKIGGRSPHSRTRAPLRA